MGDVLTAIRSLVADERLGATATVVAGSDLGTRAVIDAEHGVIAGELPEGAAGDVLADAAQLMAHEQSRTLGYGDREIFIETVAPPPVLLPPA